MTGQKPLLAMRRAGRIPACVWIHDDDSRLSKDQSKGWTLYPMPVTRKLVAQIQLSADDMPETLDLRCLVGLRVHLTSDRGDQRVSRLVRAIKETSPELLVFELGGAVEIYRSKRG